MKYKGSIKTRLIAIIMLVTILTSFIGYSSFVYWYMENQYDRSIKLSKTVALVIGQDIAKLILLNDVSAAADISTKLKSFSNLGMMVLYKIDGTPIFQYSKNNKSFKVEKFFKEYKNIKSIHKDKLKLYIDANYQGNHLGYIQLNFKVDTIYDLFKQNIKKLIVIFIFMILLSYLLAIIFAQPFINPILKLVTFLEKIELNDLLNKRIETKEQNEYGKLYLEVNTMLERLEYSHKALKIASVAFETQSGMSITDKNHKIIQVNKAFCEITGYEPKEVIGKTPAILKSGFHNEEFYEHLKDFLNKNNFWIGEIVNKRKDGTIFNEHLSIQAVLDNNGEVLYYVASFLDITKQKKIEIELVEKEKILLHQSKMASMGEMLENIAHQWRQPLSLITSSASSAQVEKEYNILDDEKLNNYLENIIKSATHLSQTVDDFRGFYKNETKKTQFNILNAINKSIDLIGSKFVNRNIKVIKTIQNKNIFGYENELIQVFINILNNATDELEKLDIANKLIFIDTFHTEDEIMIVFKDNAGGIPKEIIDKVFDSYFTTKQSSDGTGIGLYMSKLIIEKAMGSIDVFNEKFEYENKSYEGACFRIKLPMN